MAVNYQFVFSVCPFLKCVSVYCLLLCIVYLLIFVFCLLLAYCLCLFCTHPPGPGGAGREATSGPHRGVDRVPLEDQVQ